MAWMPTGGETVCCDCAADEHVASRPMDCSPNGVEAAEVCDAVLPVKRLQCTKSAKAFVEATKNDSQPIPHTLLAYLAGLLEDTEHCCTQQGISDWLITQMIESVNTGQLWSIIKVFVIVHELLWRGSTVFVNSLKRIGMPVMGMENIVALIQNTPQINLPGKPVRCTLLPFCHKDGNTRCLGEDGGEQVNADQTEKTMRHREAVLSSLAYVEALCDYRIQHPSLSLVEGRIHRRSKPRDLTSTNASITTTTPDEREGLVRVLEDTLELFKCITIGFPDAPVGCALAMNEIRVRMRDIKHLFRMAADALVGVLMAYLDQFVELGRRRPHPSSSSLAATALSPSVASPSTTSASITSPFTPVSAPTPPPPPPPSSSAGSPHVDEAQDEPHHQEAEATIVYATFQRWYISIYQFNRSIKAVMDYVAHMEESAKVKLLHPNPLRMLPQDSINSLRAFIDGGRNAGLLPSSPSFARSSSMLASSSTATTTDLAASTRQPSSIPSTDAWRTQHLAYNRMAAGEMWDQQLRAARELFSTQPPSPLQALPSGFGASSSPAVDHAIHNKNKHDDSSMTGKQSSGSPYVKQESSGGLTVDLLMPRVDGGGRGSAVLRPEEHMLRSTTYIIRHASTMVESEGESPTTVEVIPMSDTMRETDASIQALLQEDDVVVVCNEKVSCTDSMKLADRFNILRNSRLGAGTYGEVFRAWDELVGCYLAAKELQLDSRKNHAAAVREILQEYTVLTELNHKNIVRVVAFMVLRNVGRIFMEWMPSGSLQDVLRHSAHGTLRESVASRYTADALAGLAYLHQRGIIHRDVKPANMLLSAEGAVKLTDFGTSLSLTGTSQTLETGAIAGTVPYMAPEAVQGIYSAASDVWSLGCTVVHLVTGRTPWSPQGGAPMMVAADESNNNNNNNQRVHVDPSLAAMPDGNVALLFKIGSLNDTSNKERPHTAFMEANRGSGLSEELLTFLNAIFCVDRKLRPTADALLKHPFITKYQPHWVEREASMRV